MELGFEHDEFGIVVPLDIGERANLTGYNNPAALNALTLNGHHPGGDPDSWDTVNLNDLPEQPPVQPTLGDLGLIYPGKRHVLSGPQESAKTLAAYAIALEVARREQRPVIIIDFEMGRWEARNRLRDLGATPEDLQHIRYIDPAEKATPERIDKLISLNPALVVIDAAAGAYDIQGLDDNKRQDVERFTTLYVRDFWRNDIATIVLDHVVKNTENRGNYAIGSERKVGGADVHLGFEVVTPIKRGSVGLYKIVTHKDRGGYLQRGRLADLHLISDPDTHEIDWQFRPVEHTDSDQPWRPTKLMQRVSEYLASQPEHVSFNHVITNTKGRDSRIKEALEHLIALGNVIETKDAGTRNVHLKTPYSEPLPTSAAPLPEEPSATSARSAPSSGGQAEGQTNGKTPPLPEERADLDVYDPTIQHLLDQPDY